MRSLKRILFCLSIAFSLAGCHFEDVELVAIKDVTYKEFKNRVLQLDIETTINNPNRSVTLQDAHLDLWYGDKKMGTATQTEPIKLNAKSTETYIWHVSVQLDSVQDNLNALFRLLMNNSSKLRLSGTVDAKMLFGRKTITLDKQFP
ncbi:MAG: LEA type 2 family protein [Bacteroidales bacterium]|jgi:LEA14-like dessication related protein|nr:LEA type 2 family protein [Bacteroidales bacterium]